MISLIEVFESEHSYYMITDLYAGGTLLSYLRKCIKDDKKIDEIEVSIMLLQLLQGLKYLDNM